MKRIIRKLAMIVIAFTLFTALLVNPATIRAADEPTLPFTVNFLSNGVLKNISFESLDDLIGLQGTPLDTGGTFDKKYFIGWSRTAQSNDVVNQELFYTNEPIRNAVDAGLKAGDTLYPVYFDRLKVGTYFSENEVDINLDKTDVQTILNGTIKESNYAEGSPALAVGTPKSAQVYYDPTIDSYQLKLDSTFSINSDLAHWLYTGNGSSIMTNTQTDTQSAAVNAPYTHIDLNIVLPPEVDLPETLTVSFSSYYFQPYMAIKTDDRTKLTVTGATDGWNISSLASVTDPKTTFVIENPTRNMTVRTILRTNTGLGGKRIPNIPASTIAADHMTLAAEDIVTISKANAKASADNSQFIEITGDVTGYVRMPSVFGAHI